MVLLFVLVFVFGTQVTLAAVEGTIKNDTLTCGACYCRNSARRKSADCSNRNIMEVPDYLPEDINVLDLSHNNIHVFNKTINRYRVLIILHASHNKLLRLDRDDFVHLSQLEYLDLSSNSLTFRNGTYPVGLFRNQAKLVELQLQGNSELGQAGLSYPDETLSSLKSLQTLRIDGLKNCVFGQGFKDLQNLSTLSLEGYCGVRTLRNDSLENLSNIKNLSVAWCQIRYIEPSAFAPLSDIIDSLDVSGNQDLGIANLGRAMYGLQNKTVKLLNANRLHRHRGTGLLLTYDDFQFMQNVEIEELHVDENRIELLEVGVSSLLSSVKRISAKKNMALFGPYLFTGKFLKNLEWADVSGQSTSNAELINSGDDTEEESFTSIEERDTDCKYVCSSLLDDRQSSQAKMTTLQKTGFNYQRWPVFRELPFPPNVVFANFSRSKYSFTIDGFNISENKLRIIDLSHNFFTQWKGPIHGLNHLEHADLSNNFCDFVSNNFIDNFPSLKVLKVGRNYLGFILDKLNISGLRNLEYLDLSDNKITELPEHFFSSLYSLQYLDVSSNYLNSWNGNVETLKNLTNLDISNNLFESLPLNLEVQLENTLNGRLKIHLEKNPLKCNCFTLPSLDWLNTKGKHFVDLRSLTCTADSGDKLNMADLQNIVLDLQKRCASYVEVTMGVLSVVLVVLAVAISGLVYRYRWKLRYLYYLTVNRYRGYNHVEDEQPNYEFDAFVSYADEDRGFVIQNMRKTLEEPEETSEGFRLCIHHRDFLPGEAIAANILKAINTSKKTIVILTRPFLKSYWCRYEVEMAKMESIYRGRNTLLIVVMEDIPVKDLPADIVEVMRKDSYVEFTNDIAGQEVFWFNIKRALKT